MKKKDKGTTDDMRVPIALTQVTHEKTPKIYKKKKTLL